jgi:RNA-dependent RNA polymerase
VHYSGKLASTAMDFCKTGVPAEFPRELMCTAYPDFMGSKSKKTYISSKVLGKIYDMSKGTQFIHSSCDITEKWI